MTNTLQKIKKEREDKPSLYFDYAAATPISKQCLEKTIEISSCYGNPSSLHKLGKEAKSELETARQKTAQSINALPEEIIFTSGGTESCNLAIIGYCVKNKNKGNHIITSKLEHKAVLNSFEYLKKYHNFHVSYLDTNSYGQIEIQAVENVLSSNTIFASFSYGNNEIGSINPIQKLALLCKKNNICFHTDACQCPCVIDIDVQSLKVDMLSLNGSKIYGSRGVGCLYKSKEIEIEPLLHGGGQENMMRSGTENLSAIVNFSECLHIAQKEQSNENQKLRQLKEFFIQEATKSIPNITINGNAEENLPHIVNISIEGIEGDAIVFFLSEIGIYISSGSACNSHKKHHPFFKDFFSKTSNENTLRVSFGRMTKKEDVDTLIWYLSQVVNEFRKT